MSSEVKRFCGEGACSRWAAQQPPKKQGRYAPQREQAPSPQKALRAEEIAYSAGNVNRCPAINSDKRLRLIHG
ncbi:hypothetical protein, partial [Pseudomonas ogarae]|uniref:hypothetical protein n=1 Tax=Pseudomonas ogarae (strain DSM 112162 / CECT 30235 / F113) TaxID=1114970 RepID=UPI001C0F3805